MIFPEFDHRRASRTATSLQIRQNLRSSGYRVDGWTNKKTRKKIENPESSAEETNDEDETRSDDGDITLPAVIYGGLTSARRTPITKWLPRDRRFLAYLQNRRYLRSEMFISHTR